MPPMTPSFAFAGFVTPYDPRVATTHGYLDMESHMGMDQYLLRPFLGE